MSYFTVGYSLPVELAKLNTNTEPFCRKWPQPHPLNGGLGQLRPKNTDILSVLSWPLPQHANFAVPSRMLHLTSPREWMW